MSPLLRYCNSSCSHWKASKTLKHVHIGKNRCKISLEILHWPSFCQESAKNYEISTNFFHMFANACFVGEQYPYGQKLTDQNWRENYTRLQSTRTAKRGFLLSGGIIERRIGTQSEHGRTTGKNQNTKRGWKAEKKNFLKGSVDCSAYIFISLTVIPI